MIIISKPKISRVSFIPMVTSLDREMQPQEIAPGSQTFRDMLNYVKDITREVGIGTEFKVEDKEIVVVT